MLRSINNCGLCKSKKVEVSKYPETTGRGIVGKINDVFDDKAELLIVSLGANVYANDINFLMNIKRILTKTMKRSPNTLPNFWNIIIRRDQKYLQEFRVITKITQTGGLKVIVFMRILINN